MKYPIKREDAISREQFRDQMYHRCFEVDNDPNMQKWDSGNWIRWKLFEEELDKAPTAVPSRPQGKWVDSDDNTCYCSNCGAEAPIDKWEYKYRDKIRSERTDFCPDCGARMKGADDE